MKEFIFRVADCYFSVLLPKEWSVSRLLPSFRSFLYQGKENPSLLFQLTAGEERNVLNLHKGELLEESTNDLGCVRISNGNVGLHIEISYDEDRAKIHTLEIGRDFTKATAGIIYMDETAGVALSSMLRMMFAETILGKGGISVHASCVCKEGKGFLFLGKSGTGKSTHAEKWMETFSTCKLLNDDNPIIRLNKGEVRVYGSPWSGKKHCYKQENYPVGGIVRLIQALDNRFVALSDADAFMAMLPSCSVYRNDNQSHEILYETVISMIERIPMGILYCLPDKKAAILCCSHFEKFSF